MRWKTTVRIKHLFTDAEDHEGVQSTMNAIADVLESEPLFTYFDAGVFRSIPQGDDVFGPADYANKWLERMYDYADAHGIWID